MIWTAPAEEDSDKDSDEGEEPSNREMFDNNNAQKLKESAIDEMKKEGKICHIFREWKGVTGKEIIEKIVVNSDTFSKRTVYSKEKYLKKKKQKYRFYLNFTLKGIWFNSESKRSPFQI